MQEVGGWDQAPGGTEATRFGAGFRVDDFREQLSRLFMGDLIAAEKTRWRVLSP